MSRINRITNCERPILSIGAIRVILSKTENSSPYENLLAREFRHLLRQERHVVLFHQMVDLALRHAGTF